MAQIHSQPDGCNSTPNVNVDFLLASMRCASLNLKLWSNEIDAIGVALKAGLYSTDDALADLNSMGVLAYLPVPERGAA